MSRTGPPFPSVTMMSPRLSVLCERVSIWLRISASSADSYPGIAGVSVNFRKSCVMVLEMFASLDAPEDCALEGPDATNAPAAKTVVQRTEENPFIAKPLDSLFVSLVRFRELATVAQTKLCRNHFKRKQWRRNENLLAAGKLVAC